MRNEILKQIFKDHDTTQKDFAKKVGVSKNNLSLWLRDEQDISFGKLEIIANKLNYKLKISL